MIEELKSIADEISRRIAAEIQANIQGDGAGVCATFPFLGTWTGITNPEPLTFDVLQKMIANFPPAPRGPVKIIEVEPYPIYGPARRHRKRRIQKKWLKRYGRQVVGYEYPMGDNVLVDEKRGVGYCHPHVARQIRENTTAA
jgi:hypothetical protein